MPLSAALWQPALYLVCIHFYKFLQNSSKTKKIYIFLQNGINWLVFKRKGRKAENCLYCFSRTTCIIRLVNVEAKNQEEQQDRQHWTIHQTLPLLPIRHTICHSQFACSRISDIPYLTLPKSLNMYGDYSACSKGWEGGGATKSKLMLWMTILMSLQSVTCTRPSNPASPPPSPLRCSFLVFRYFDFHEASCLARNEETGTKRADREGFLSSHRLSDNVTATHSVIFAIGNSHHWHCTSHTQ